MISVLLGPEQADVVSSAPPVPSATVLVVDDEPLNRSLLRQRLEPEGHRVLEANDGEAALRSLAEHGEVDLVLLDVRMPGLDGLEVCRRIRARSAEGFLPVLLLTALGGQEDRHEGLQAGADDFLTKPVDGRELLLRVRALLRLRQQDRTIRAQVAHAREQEAVIRQQLEELRHLSALKDDLFALVVHDLRNPLTGLAGYLDLLREDLQRGRGERAPGLAQRAHEATSRLRSLLEELLEVQRLERGELTLQRRPVAVGELVEEAARSLEGAVAARELSLQVVTDGRLEATLDPGLVRRALENLLGNAVRFSPLGSVVTLSARAEGGWLTLRVEDQGPGVAAGLKGSLFRKFGAVDAGAVRRGFGLGLHLVRLVAETHGGRAFVEDAPGGRGAVFGLTLPREPARDPA